MRATGKSAIEEIVMTSTRVTTDDYGDEGDDDWDDWRGWWGWRWRRTLWTCQRRNLFGWMSKTVSMSVDFIALYFLFSKFFENFCFSFCLGSTFFFFHVRLVFIYISTPSLTRLKMLISSLFEISKLKKTTPLHRSPFHGLSHRQFSFSFFFKRLNCLIFSSLSLIRSLDRCHFLTYPL